MDCFLVNSGVDIQTIIVFHYLRLCCKDLWKVHVKTSYSEVVTGNETRKLQALKVGVRIATTLNYYST